MSTFRGITVIAILASTLLVSPSLAEKNTGGFQIKVNAAANKQLCADLKDVLDVNEGEADRLAGTKAAAPYAKSADKAWSDGVKWNCNWAK